MARRTLYKDGYKAGDSLYLAGGIQLFGTWADSAGKTLRFMIELDREVFADNMSLTGTLIFRHEGTSSGDVTIDANTMTVTFNKFHAGILVQITFNEAPRYAAPNCVVAVQPVGCTLSFS